MELQPGQKIDRFLLVRRLGGGGQGEVWQAVDLLFPGRYLALKRVAPEQGKLVNLERARREAHLLAGLSHPGLVRCYQLIEGLLSDEVLLVMELAEGRPLDGLLDDPRMTPAHREAVAIRVAEALAALHQAGVVHRDIKPANVMVSEQFWGDLNAPGTIKLVDLGISVEVGNPAPLTQIDRVIGTPPYMAPEYLVPSQFDSVLGPTPAMDVFAWGIFCWEVFWGSHPTGLPAGSSIADFAVAYLAARSRHPWAMRPRHHPLAPLIEQCLAIEPDRRPPSAIEVLRLLRAAHALPPQIAARTEETPPPSAPPASRSPLSSGTAPVLLPHESSPSFDPPSWSPVIPVPPPSRAARRSATRRSWGWLLALLCLFLLLGAGAAAVAISWFEPGWLDIFPALGRRVPKKKPGPAIAVQPNPPTTPAPSCLCSSSGPTLGCASRHSVIVGRGCDDALPPDSIWQLRFSFVRLVNPSTQIDRVLDDPAARVRVCVIGTNRCEEVSIGESQKEPSCFTQPRLSILARDLTGPGLSIRVFDGRGVLAAEAHGVRHETLKTSALCQGIVFSPGASSKIAKIGFFLDG